MHADGGEQGGVSIGETDTGFEVGRAVAGANRDHLRDAGRERTIDHCVAIGIELLAVEVAVRVEEAHLRRAPMGASSRKPTSMGLSPSAVAATIMPCDSRPRSLRGCRLATMTTLRPTISSGL